MTHAAVVPGVGENGSPAAAPPPSPRVRSDRRRRPTRPCDLGAGRAGGWGLHPIAPAPAPSRLALWLSGSSPFASPSRGSSAVPGSAVALLAPPCAPRFLHSPEEDIGLDIPTANGRVRARQRQRQRSTVDGGLPPCPSRDTVQYGVRRAPGGAPTGLALRHLCTSAQTCPVDNRKGPSAYCSALLTTAWRRAECGVRRPREVMSEHVRFLRSAEVLRMRMRPEDDRASAHPTGIDIDRRGHRDSHRNLPRHLAIARDRLAATASQFASSPASRPVDPPRRTQIHPLAPGRTRRLDLLPRVSLSRFESRAKRVDGRTGGGPRRAPCGRCPRPSQRGGNEAPHAIALAAVAPAFSCSQASQAQSERVGLGLGKKDPTPPPAPEPAPSG
ncbi:hypothetical protein L226DRAFT_312712 [Lentinus tigrinus ALCF2SS1-7]|uniref:Uncharacterized protein n=1 Tax=Lentinus tigrinus ALCF2SS1-6 TaxID=1328759 RepID=A0A5C2RR72_9APHY|nr:hypothetical protein L227DRAFT_370828 [Lentinus tigrinus ALCF2SS1-6]RPD68895.1 hypothetical protein L226DRAFT_312712 [Lentinus tigrinus ALCF2SS1-7]